MSRCIHQFWSVSSSTRHPIPYTWFPVLPECHNSHLCFQNVKCPVNWPKEHGRSAAYLTPGNQERQYSTNDSSNGGAPWRYLEKVRWNWLDLSQQKRASCFFHMSKSLCVCESMMFSSFCALCHPSVLRPRRIKRRIAPTAVLLCLGVVLVWASPTCTLLASNVSFKSSTAKIGIAYRDSQE